MNTKQSFRQYDDEQIIKTLTHQVKAFTGTYKELLDSIGIIDITPKKLANVIKRNVGYLQKNGFEVYPERGKKSSNKGRCIVIRKP